MSERAFRQGLRQLLPRPLPPRVLLAETVLAPVPLRHLTFTISKMFRPLGQEIRMDSLVSRPIELSCRPHQRSRYYLAHNALPRIVGGGLRGAPQSEKADA